MKLTTGSIEELDAESLLRLVKRLPPGFSVNMESLLGMTEDPVRRGLLFGLVRHGTLKGESVEEAYRHAIDSITLRQLVNHGFLWYHAEWRQLRSIIQSVGEDPHPVLRSPTLLTLPMFIKLANRGILSDPLCKELAGRISHAPNVMRELVENGDGFAPETLSMLGPGLPLSKGQWRDYLRIRLSKGQFIPRDLGFAGLDTRGLVGIVMTVPYIRDILLQAPGAWEACTDDQRSRLMYKWAHHAMKNQQWRTFMSQPESMLKHFRPKALASLMVKARFEDFITLLRYALKHASISELDHDAMSSLALKNLPRKNIVQLVEAGLRLRAETETIDEIFGSQHEYLEALHKQEALK